MATSAEPLAYPALGIIEGGLTHAAQPGVVPEHGWGRAMCNRRLYVSIEHISQSHGGQMQTVPLRATSDCAPTMDDDWGVIGEGVDCNKCRRALAKWERAHSEAKED